MLTAKTKTGKMVNLGYDYMKETLMDLRGKEEFECPVCGEEVILKLGEHRIFHFAHKRGNSCCENFEGETPYHLEGKKQLYQWFIRQKIPSQLEYYDSKIKQRPDIMFMYEGSRYALEYQCSPIPEAIFMKRTDTYLSNGYIPLWILGADHIQSKKRNIISLSAFHYLFARKSPEGCIFIPTYCPVKRAFILFGSILPYSVRNAFAQNHFFPQTKCTLDTILNPKEITQINIHYWTAEMEKTYLNWTLHKSPQQQSFLHELYRSNMNPYLLPSEIGLPVKHSLLIQTPPIIWQTYLYLDQIADKEPGDLLNPTQIKLNFQRRKEKNQIQTRIMAQFSKVNPLLAELEYFLILEKLGILSRCGEYTFQLRKTLFIPRTNREKEKRNQAFLKKYQFLLSKP